MCDSDTRDYNRAMRKEPPLTALRHVSLTLPLASMNEMYVQATHAQRVLREGNPERKVALAQEILAKLCLSMDAASCGFLAPRN